MSEKPLLLPAPLGLRHANALFDAVFAPLVLGGKVRPVRPLGITLGEAVAAQGEAVMRRGDVLASQVEVARVRVARRLYPLDTLPPPSPAEWRLVAAWNDLLQVANPYLPGFFASSRPARLLDLVRRGLSGVEPPQSLGECLGRHATLARILSVTRTDVDVSWWTGSASFLGEAPPARLLAWPERRRVRAETRTVELTELPPEELRRDFSALLSTLLWLTPLTDLATVKRTIPLFGWTPGTLALLPSPRGRALARRAIPEGTRADVALEKAADALPPAARANVLAFLTERRALSAAAP